MQKESTREGRGPREYVSPSIIAMSSLGKIWSFCHVDRDDTLKQFQKLFNIIIYHWASHFPVQM